MSSSPIITSLKGDKGDDGAQGIQGIQGDKGDKGDTGIGWQAGTDPNDIENTNSGNVGIGLTDPQAKLDVSDSIYIHGVSWPGLEIRDLAENKWLLQHTVSDHHLRFRYNAVTMMTISPTALGTGTVYSNGTVLTNTNPSDLRMKTNVLTTGYGLDCINMLRPVEFDWLDSETHGKQPQLGFIAQEVVNVLPEIVRGDEKEDYGLESIQIIPVLVKAIQELTERLERTEELLNI